MSLAVSSSETAAPAWLPLVFIAVPVLIMLAVLVPALRRRARASEARRAHTARRRPAATPVGSAARIDDPSAVSPEAMLRALAVRPEEHGPTADGTPHDEASGARALGLRAKVASASEVLEPHVFWGTREGRQVFIRLGPDEKLEGGTTMLSNRHIRAITVVRVASSPFTVVSDDGALVVGDDAPSDLRGLVATIRPDRPTWGATRVTAGADGIVAWRPAIDGTGAEWVFDLWLLERIARELDLPPLPPARIGPAWKVPYELGRSLTPAV